MIEENGPVRTVIKATGTHKDSSGNSYMRFTVRMHFYKGKSTARVTVTLRNADLGASNSFASASKGFESFEWRTALNIAGTTNTYVFGTHSGGTSTSTLAATDDAYIYQGQSSGPGRMVPQDNTVPSPDYTADTGYDVRKNTVSQTTGTSAQISGGYGNCENPSGVGLLVQHYFPGAYYPKSIGFNDACTDTRIGIWPTENSSVYYQAWPQYSTHDLFFSFHAAALSSNVNEGSKLQHKLIARAPITHYNDSAVFPTKFIDSATEDAFYTATWAVASPSLSAGRDCCVPDLGLSSANFPIAAYREYAWGNSGPSNQPDRHWNYLMQWLIRGMPGRYLDGMHFHGRYMTDFAIPHSDGFTWRSQTGDYSFAGQPTATSSNISSTYRSGPQWQGDVNHEHWWGIGDAYFLSGDEAIRDALVDDALDHFIASGIYARTGQLAATRAVGHYLLLTTRLATFLATVGATADAAAVSAVGQEVFEKQVKPDLCVNDTPTAMSTCDADFDPNGLTTWNDGTTVNPGSRDGISRSRGVHQGDSQSSTEVCGGSGIRIANAFMTSILIQGLLDTPTTEVRVGRTTGRRGTRWTACVRRDNELLQNRRHRTPTRTASDRACVSMTRTRTSRTGRRPPPGADVRSGLLCQLGHQRRQRVGLVRQVQDCRPAGHGYRRRGGRRGPLRGAVEYRNLSPGESGPHLAPVRPDHQRDEQRRWFLHDSLDRPVRYRQLPREIREQADRGMDRLRPGLEYLCRQPHDDHELVCGGERLGHPLARFGRLDAEPDDQHRARHRPDGRELQRQGVRQRARRFNPAATAAATGRTRRALEPAHSRQRTGRRRRPRSERALGHADWRNGRRQLDPDAGDRWLARVQRVPQPVL